jgi:hypothetical protein
MMVANQTNDLRRPARSEGRGRPLARSAILRCAGTSVACLALAAGGYAQSGSITTTFVSNGGGSNGGVNFFDAQVLNPLGLTVTSLDVNCNFTSPPGTAFTVEVFTIPGTYMGNHSNMAAWTLVSSGNAISNPPDTPTPADVSDFFLPQGNWGIAIQFVNAGLRYTNGNGSNQNYQNADIALALGAAQNVAFSTQIFTPRVWNGTIYYDVGSCTGNVTTYCTSKVTSAGCTPAIAATGTPSASAGGGFVVSTTNVLDNRFGLYFYSKSGANNAPFQGGTLCALPPLTRTPVQDSGGTAPCGGMYSIDFNAYVASGKDPALVAGAQVWIQTWGRDPGFPAPNNTSLSDALSCTICP